MNQDNLWSAFAKTGRIEDYLRYCGIDIYETGINTVARQSREELPPHASDNRRPHHTGKQQYR